VKICIYNEPYGEAMGGCEVCVAVLATALAGEHDVEIVHYRPQMTREVLANFTNTDLNEVQLRLGPPLSQEKGGPWRMVARNRKEKREEAGIGGDCDVFVSFNHHAPVFSKADLQILVVLFPFATSESMFERTSQRTLRSTLTEAAKAVWHRWKLRRRLRRYQVKLAISAFSRTWTRRRWGVDSQVVFPPVEVKQPTAGRKDNYILSVGRFASGGGVSKKQIEMLTAFADLRGKGSWNYDCVGACGSSDVELAFFHEAAAVAERAGARVEANLDGKRLRELYGRARIFWHATGLDVDVDSNPELAEHFGMATVEAMAAGCVPVVINKGGQKEIVEHGVSGFLWDTLEELQGYSARLMEDSHLLETMGAAAKARAQEFSRDAFVSQFRAILKQNNIRPSERVRPSCVGSGAG
jgi:glycosyltransferase involved in cell wall biosynthesis